MNRTTAILLRRVAPAVLLPALIAIASHGCNNSKSAGAGGAQSGAASAAPPQRTFASPQDALDALVAAMRAHDDQQLEAIFGPDSDDVLFSGDSIDDQLTQDRFLKAYDEKHRLVPSDQVAATTATATAPAAATTAAAPDSFTVLVGKDDWPLPIPIVRDDSAGAWVFDTDDGKDEVITRRIGRNELTVIQVCKAICDAQREYAQRDPNHDAVPEYARLITSNPDKKDGLYWPTAEGEPLSPLGELVAQAQGEGYSFLNPTGEPRPYHGYLYRILTAQGKDAPGGAADYIVDGKLIGGFAVLAWPADYGSSGIMTFIANYNGDVFQKDLGDDTDKLARSMTQYNPDATWKPAE